MGQNLWCVTYQADFQTLTTKDCTGPQTEYAEKFKVYQQDIIV